MDILIVIEFVAVILGCFGVLLVSLLKREGLWLISIAQIGWIFLGYVKGMYFFVGQGIILIIFNMIGVYTWRKKKIG